MSKDEIEVIRAVSMGWSDSEMASRFGWSEERVAQSVDQVLAKLKLSSHIELAFYACTEEGRTVLQRSVA